MAKTEQLKLLGDKRNARNLRTFAFSQRDKLLEQMEYGGLLIGTRTVMFDNSAKIVINSVYGHTSISIFAPPEPLPENKIIEVSVVVEYGNVMYSYDVTNSERRVVPSTIRCFVRSNGSGELESVRINADNNPANGNHMVWKSAPDDDNDIDIICYGGPYAGGGQHRMDIDGMPGTAQYMSHSITVNGITVPVSTGDDTLLSSNSPGVLGACIREFRDKKYIVVAICNTDYQTDYGYNNWEFNGLNPTYDVTVNYEAKVYYAPYNKPLTVATVPSGAYHKQDNPTGWRFADYAELVEVINNHTNVVTGSGATGAGMWQFNSSGNKAICKRNNYVGKEVSFDPTSWKITSKLLKLVPPISYIHDTDFTYETKHTTGAFTMVDGDISGHSDDANEKGFAFCFGLGYYDDVITGLYYDPIVTGYSLDYGEAVSNHAYFESSIFFLDIRGVKQIVLDRREECDGVTTYYNGTISDYNITYTPAIFSGDADRFVNATCKRSLGDDYMYPFETGEAGIYDRHKGIHWVDISTKSLSLCCTHPGSNLQALTNDFYYSFDSTGKIGAFVFVEGVLQHRYIVEYETYRHYMPQAARSWPNLTEGEVTYVDYTSTPTYNPNDLYYSCGEGGHGCTTSFEYVPFTRMRFVVVGGVAVGEITFPLGTADKDFYLDFEHTEFIDGYNNESVPRIFAGLFPKVVEEKFMSLEASGTFDPTLDSYFYVYPYKLTRTSKIFLYDEAFNLIGEKI